jgi:hypothetical protein
MFYKVALRVKQGEREHVTIATHVLTNALTKVPRSSGQESQQTVRTVDFERKLELLNTDTVVSSIKTSLL